MAVLKLNSKTILKYFDGLSQETAITMYYGAGEPLKVTKKNIIYDIENHKILMIFDKYTSKLYLIKINKINSIKFNGKRFGVNKWKRNTEKFVIGDNESKMSI